ncbi:MAG TPA: hypothetical protein VK400_16090 [Pyrinomonadaceae bacterium]|nr:hypothetical protein [Pyrinomonadaceae bacterium]
MRAIFNLLVVFACLLSLFILAIIVLSIIYGGFSILLPGLGLIITFQGIVGALLIIDFAIIAVAFFIRRFGLKSEI